MKTRITQLTIVPDCEPIYSERATNVSIDDEAAGEYIVISQDEQKISLNPDEWPFIVEAVERLIKEIKEHHQQGHD